MMRGGINMTKIEDNLVRRIVRQFSPRSAGGDDSNIFVYRGESGLREYKCNQRDGAVPIPTAQELRDEADEYVCLTYNNKLYSFRNKSVPNSSVFGEMVEDNGPIRFPTA